MDPLTHLSRKILLENSRQNQNPQQPPPPYSSNSPDADDDDYNSDADSNASDHETDPTPINLTINATNSIRGSNNLLPTSPTPLADATKFSTLLLHAVNQINASATAAAEEGRARRGRCVRVDLTINCGVTVVGDRNVVGNVGLRPRQTPAFALAGRPAGTAGVALGNAPAAVGAKRKVEEDSDDEREAKRVDTGNEDAASTM